ncbi:MAG: F0F1 ATP synthase subunit B [Clostridia bacterium]|nr:F0F1 ATP synthase subunit B [Clostridia bacterium]
MEFQWFLDKFENFVGVNLWTMIFAWVNLLILYLVLKKILFKPVRKMIETRQKEVDDMYTDAEESKTAANEMKTEYEAKLRDAETESEEILRSAQRRAQLKEEEILRDAREQAQRTLDRAEEQVELEKKRAINEVKDEVSEMAIGIAAAVIERDISEDEHRELIDSFIDKMGEE